MRVAIAGAGLMGKWHAYYARRCGASVCGIIDPKLPAAEVRRRFPGASAFEKLELLLNEFQPAVLHICSPAGTHEDLIEQALEARVHVLVEKPLAATVTATERLVEKAAVHGVLLNPVHQYVFQEGFLRGALALSDIGKPMHFEAVVCSAGGAERQDDELDALIADILPHPLSALDRLFPGILGEIKWTVIQSMAGEWYAMGESHSLLISIRVSLHGRPTESSLRLIGTRGTIHVDFFHGFAFAEAGTVSRSRKIAHPFSLGTLMLWSAGGNLLSRVIHREPAYPGLRRLIQEFYRAAGGHSEPPLPVGHVIDVARVRDRLMSASVRRPTH